MGPILSLGSQGSFDDTHIFAPCVALEQDEYCLWYCGSTGSVAERVFSVGLATSRDGKSFQRVSPDPVYTFGDGKHSVLTPTLLRSAEGAVLRENGALRMWFSATHFAGPSGLHALHEATSQDGVHWSPPTPPQLENAYAPSILKEGETYRMWYVDVGTTPWVLRYAESRDGRRWRVRPQPVVQVDQAWERGNLFYPTVVKASGVYLMWYGSYWGARSQKTALGFAASLDGWRWYKHPDNPVLRPDPDREWESHYTTSQSVMRGADGTWRMWYASRKSPPFVNKYFAINTARWSGPQATASSFAEVLDEKRLKTEAGRAAFHDWQSQMRSRLRGMLGIPLDRPALEAESRGKISQGDIIIEKWIYTSESGSRIPAVVYRPKEQGERLPAVVLAFGHGGSKSQAAYQYFGQAYAKLGFACLAADPIGEEERHAQGRLGTRTHDPYPVHRRAWDAGRPIMGKLVYDTMRGVDFMLSRKDIDSARIGVAGNSLGGAKAGWMATLDDRLTFAIVSGWAFSDVTIRSKYCTSVPNQHMREWLQWPEYLALAAPHCRVLVMNGTADVIIDRDADGSAWAETRQAVSRAEEVYAALGRPGGIRCWFEREGGHRPYPAHRAALQWLLKHVQPEGRSKNGLDSFADINYGAWAKQHGIAFEKLYGTPLHLRGATVVDLQITPLESLRVLTTEELGQPQYTIEGWLDRIDPPHP
jgi:dienelactone hydrolase